MGCLLVASYRVGENLEIGTAAPIRDSATARLGNRRVANRDPRGIFVSLLCGVHCSGVRLGETARFCLSSLPPRVHVSFIQASSDAPAWVKWPLYARPCPVPGRLAAQERQTQPPPGTSLWILETALVLLDFAYSHPASTRF